MDYSKKPDLSHPTAATNIRLRSAEEAWGFEEGLYEEGFFDKKEQDRD
jgi:hypothetical protein